MQIELFEHPHITPSLALHDYEQNPGALPDDETESTDEQMRLLLSWRAVLGGLIHCEAGAGQW
jgi:hypothetical protein